MEKKEFIKKLKENFNSDNFMDIDCNYGDSVTTFNTDKFFKFIDELEKEVLKNEMA